MMQEGAVDSQLRVVLAETRGGVVGVWERKTGFETT